MRRDTSHSTTPATASTAMRRSVGLSFDRDRRGAGVVEMRRLARGAVGPLRFLTVHEVHPLLVTSHPAR